jgi:predicted DNA-binding transcriptional regulator AlpA
MTQDIIDPIYSEQFVSKWTNTSRPTLQRQRSNGSGPPFVQLSERRIGYRKSAVERWLEERTINRVGELISPAQAPEPAAQPYTPVTATLDDAKAATKMERASGRRLRRAGHD